jgi:hypothetical protein
MKIAADTYHALFISGGIARYTRGINEKYKEI